MKFYDLFMQLTILNPGVKFNIDDPSLVSDPYENIYCSVSPDKLILPEGFYYNEKNGITNKHNTENGMYMSVKVGSSKEFVKRQKQINTFVKDIQKVQSPITAQKFYNEVVKETIPENTKEEHDFYSFVYEIKRLNPWLQLDVVHPQFSGNPVLYYTKPKNITSEQEKGIIFPKGFGFDKATQTATNKHTSKTGLYIEIELRNLEKTKEKDPDIENTLMTDKQLERFYARSPRLKDQYAEQIPNLSTSDDMVAMCYALQKLNPDMDFTLPNPNKAPISFDSVVHVRPKLTSIWRTAIRGMLKEDVFILPDGWTQIKKDIYQNEKGQVFTMKVSMKKNKDCFTQKELKEEFKNNQTLYLSNKTENELTK